MFKKIAVVLIVLIAAMSFSFADRPENMPVREKMVICHFPPGNPENYQTIEVANVAVLNAHLDHGDLMGPCALVCDLPRDFYGDREKNKQTEDVWDFLVSFFDRDN